MNNFTIVGKFKNIKQISPNNYIINILSTSPTHKNINIPIRISKNNFINKLKENDLLGISGTIDEADSNIIFLATKIIWLPNK